MPRVAIEAMGAAMTATEKIPCPFTYANGKQCPGQVVGIRAFRADPEWQLDAAGVWRFECVPRSRYYLVCSEQGGHEQLKLYYDRLPEALQRIVEHTSSREFSPRAA